MHKSRKRSVNSLEWFRISCIGLCASLLSGCLGITENAEAVSEFELDRYLGQWYEIARLDHRFERGLTHVRAEYRLREDGGVRVTNTGFDTEKQEWSTAEGKAFFVGEPTIGRLKVSFFGPFYGAYNIIELDQENYQYAMIVGPSTKYLWILARNSKLDPIILDRLIAKAASLGFAVDTLIFPEHGEPMHTSQSNKLDLNVGPWTAVNDGVMGGVSTSQMIANDNGLRFQGTLSLENNGGFASVRRPLKKGLEGVEDILLNIQGDGRRYQLRLRLDNNWDGVAWRHEFTTSGQWQRLRFALEDFVPVFRGRTLKGYEPLDPSRVRQLGFMLADGQARPFQLDIADIEFQL